jgi:hypothetical protein
MARPRTPTNVLDARGAFKKHPERRREDPEPAGELGEPPLYFSAPELQCWTELVSITPRGVLTARDRWVVEMAARLMAEYRELGRKFPLSGLQRLHFFTRSARNDAG